MLKKFKIWTAGKFFKASTVLSNFTRSFASFPRAFVAWQCVLHSKPHSSNYYKCTIHIVRRYWLTCVCIHNGRPIEHESHWADGFHGKSILARLKVYLRTKLVVSSTYCTSNWNSAFVVVVVVVAMILLLIRGFSCIKGMLVVATVTYWFSLAKPKFISGFRVVPTSARSFWCHHRCYWLLYLPDFAVASNSFLLFCCRPHCHLSVRRFLNWTAPERGFAGPFLSIM